MIQPALEFQRRAPDEQRLATFFLARPGVWVPMLTLQSEICSAWRSRLPRVRRRFLNEHLGVVEWNQQNSWKSAYRFVPEGWLEAPRCDG